MYQAELQSVTQSYHECRKKIHTLKLDDQFSLKKQIKQDIINFSYLRNSKSTLQIKFIKENYKFTRTNQQIISFSLLRAKFFQAVSELIAELNKKTFRDIYSAIQLNPEFNYIYCELIRTLELEKKHALSIIKLIKKAKSAHEFIRVANYVDNESLFLLKNLKYELDSHQLLSNEIRKKLYNLKMESPELIAKHNTEAYPLHSFLSIAKANFDSADIFSS